MTTTKMMFTVLVFLTLIGCATSTTILKGTLEPPKSMKTAALTSAPGNTDEMTTIIKIELAAVGINALYSAGPETRKFQQSDLVVEYSAKWKWDVFTYLQTLEIHLYDAQTGNLAVSGRWDNAEFHGFQKPQDVAKQLIKEMLEKLNKL